MSVNILESESFQKMLVAFERYENYLKEAHQREQTFYVILLTFIALVFVFVVILFVRHLRTQGNNGNE